MRRIIDLSGEWNMTMEPQEGASIEGVITLPGTTAQQKLGVKNPKHEEGYLTEDHPFTGKIIVRRRVQIMLQPEEKAELYLERTRITRVWLDGSEIAAEEGTENSLIAAHRYDLTAAVTGEDQELMIEITNTGYPVPGGHMTSPDTQTNWIGITGEISVRILPDIYVENMQTVTDVSEGKASVIVYIKNVSSKKNKAKLRIKADSRSFEKEVDLNGKNITETISFDTADLRLWDELKACMYPVLCELYIGEEGSFGEEPYDSFSLQMGFRDFRPEGRRFMINGSEVFLRGKHDGLVFPLEGAAPTDVDSWLRVMRTAKEYGVNHYRFHTCCPPDAAFTAADMLGIYMSPELPFWGTIHGTEDPECDRKGQEYLIEEGVRLLSQFCHHPSFVMLSMGNELWGSSERLREIIRILKKANPYILMTQGSNNFQFIPCILPEEDYFVGVRFAKNRLFRGSYAMCDEPLGPVQTQEPGTDWDYEEAILGSTYSDSVKKETKNPDNGASGNDSSDDNSVNDDADEIEIQFGTGVKKVSASDAAGTEELVPHVPVISHEIGQYSMYPDIRRASQYKGALRADNFEIYRQRLEEKGLLGELPAMIRDSGALAMQCYKAELEAAYRSGSLSGFQLLDLQDFPGQGGAYVGVLDAFMNSKGLISSEEWREFCNDIVLLARFPGHLLEEGKELALDLWIRDMHSGIDISGELMQLRMSGAGEGDETLYEEEIRLPSVSGGLTRITGRSLKLPMLPDGKVRELTLTLSVDAKGIRNHYSFWLFPQLDEYRDEKAVISSFSDHGIHIAGNEEQYAAAVREGGKLLYIPEEIKESIPGDYPSDFWCYPMFRSISESMGRKVPIGTLGLSMNPGHPALKEFATESFTTPEWYQIISHGYPAILDGTDVKVLVRDIDNIERNHNLGLIFEYRENDTDVLVVASPLLKLLEYKEVRALLRCLINYMTSEDFRPEVPERPWNV